jgi:chromosomal replication initiator protein
MEQRLSGGNRQVVGAIARMRAYSKATRVTQKVDAASDLLRDLLDNSEEATDPAQGGPHLAKGASNVTTDRIMAVVAARHGLTIADLRGPHRDRRTAYARHIGMFVCRDLTPLSLGAIGQAFDRDAASVLHGCRRIEERISSDRWLREEVGEIEAAVCA